MVSAVAYLSVALQPLSYKGWRILSTVFLRTYAGNLCTVFLAVDTYGQHHAALKAYSIERHRVSMKALFGRVVMVFMLGLLVPVVRADTATVAVASNFSQAARALEADFESRQPARVRLVLGSSAKLFAQINHGAPFDIFLSADESKPHILIEQGLAETSQSFIYAQGALVLWSLDAELLATEEALQACSVDKLALANPRLAPYGLAAQQTLQALGCYEARQGQLVMGENVGQAFQFVVTGNVPMGFVAAAQLRSWKLQANAKQQGSYWSVPADLHQPISQAAVMLKRARGNSAAQAFMRYLSSPQAQQIIQDQGYQLP